MEKFEISIEPFRLFIPIIVAKLPQFFKFGGRLIDVHALVNKIIADGKINQDDIALLIAAFIQAPNAPKPPVVLPPAPPIDNDVPDEPAGPLPIPPGVVTSGKVAKIELSRIRAVLNPKRFPNQDLNVDPNSPVFNYATAVTFEAKLLDAAGNILDTGKHGGTGHTKTTRYFCQGPDGSVAEIGPDENAKGTHTIGAGGKNYVENNGTNATFRFGFATVPVDGDFKVWAEEDGVKSNEVISRVS